MASKTVPGNRSLKQDRNKHHVRRHLLRRSHYRIISGNGSTLNQGSATKAVSKCQKMTRLLRHDLTVLPEEDGAVEYRILAPMSHTRFTSSPYWSIRTWLSYFQKGSGLKKRFQFCADPYSADTILYLRAIQSYAGGKHIVILHCKTTCCYRATSPSTSTTLEAPRYALDHSIWIDSGWEEVSKGRHAMLFQRP